MNVFEALTTVVFLGEVLALGILRALISPPLPRFRRIGWNPSHSRSLERDDPFLVLNFMGLVERHGYPAEEHNVTTVDGYKLILHRIPGSPLSPNSSRKPIVYMQHGILCSSDCWVLMGPKKDLAFLLADAGYDVWIGNVRGNTYSRAHQELHPSDPQFWRFSYHEMALYDLPAMIDYALGRTGRESLIYIGHSMGMTVSYALLSTRPEYGEKIRLIVSMAPVAYWKHRIDGFMKIAVDNAENFERTLRLNGIFELAPQSANNARLGKAFCDDRAITQPACISLIFELSGPDYKQLNTTLIPYITSYYPAGVSVQTLLHYRQNIVSGNFQRYDYGTIGNFAHYGRKEPPHYDVKKIAPPVAIFYGLNDVLVRKEDVAELERRLPNLILSEPQESFNHIDFQWGTKANALLYDRIIDIMEKYREREIDS